MTMTDEFLLSALRHAPEVAMDTRRAAADRIEEYCTDAACAEEALLRCYMAAGGKIEDLPSGDDHAALETMAQRVLASIPYAERSWQALRLAREQLFYVPDDQRGVTWGEALKAIDDARRDAPELRQMFNNRDAQSGVKPLPENRVQDSALDSREGDSSPSRPSTEVRLDGGGELDEVHGRQVDAGIENMDTGSWFLYIGDVAVWLHSTRRITATYERRGTYAKQVPAETHAMRKES